jgi:hypothetical protein
MNIKGHNHDHLIFLKLMTKYLTTIRIKILVAIQEKEFMQYPPIKKLCEHEEP